MNHINALFLFILFSIVPIYGMESVDKTAKKECESSVNDDQVRLIEDYIKDLMRLRCTNKEYNASLTCEVIGEALKHYAQEDKDAVFENLMKVEKELFAACKHESEVKQCLKNRYELICFPALILICAGANPAINFDNKINLLAFAAKYNDMYMVKKMFEHTVDPNIADHDGPFIRPILYDVTTKEMAQMFIDNGIDLHNAKLRNRHSLRTMLRNKFPLELIEFYLAKGVGHIESDNFCWDLLYELTSDYLRNNGDYFGCTKKYSIKDIDTLFKKAELLCTYMPQDKLNTLKGSDTLIDTAQWRLRSSSRDSLLADFYEKLIMLYQQHGGFTGCEVYKNLAAQAEEYNQTNSSLSALPQEIFFDICSYYQEKNQKQNQSCASSIKNFMRLRGTCKKLNQYLTSEAIGGFCKSYGQVDKNELFKKIVGSIERDRYSNQEWHSYQSRRLPASILVCAGADPNTKVENCNYLLKHAADHNDAQMVKLLFEHKVDPHKEKDSGYYSYYENIKKSPLRMCKTREVAQIFFDNKVSVSDENYPNVLWRILDDEYPPDLVKCCLENGLDATKLHASEYDKKEVKCLLHHIALQKNAYELKNTNELLEKTKFLLDVMPKEMVNSLSNKKTPIDIAQYRYSKAHRNNDSFVEFYEKLICLYRQYGGLSGFALSKKIAAEAKQHNCVQPLVHMMSEENIYPIFLFSKEHEQDQAESLIKSIKNFMHLRATCKQLNELLSDEVIGDQCKDYMQDDKNKALEKVGKSLDVGWNNTKLKKFLVLALVCAGADPNASIRVRYQDSCLLEYAVHNNDELMIEALFKHKVHVNVTNPALYKTKQIAQLFMNNGVDVHGPVDDYPNVLWRVVENTYPADLLEFYLEKGVDPKQLSSHDYFGAKQDLLCYVTDGVRDSYGDYHRDNIKKVELLIKAMPEKINTVWGWRTLIDIVQDKHGLCKTSEFGHNMCCNSCEEFIALFRKHGGLTAQELELQKG